MSIEKKDTLTITIERGSSLNELGETTYSVTGKLFVNDTQVGYVSSISASLKADQLIPEVTVELLSGLSQEACSSLPENLRDKIRDNVNLLKNLEFVTVKVGAEQ